MKKYYYDLHVHSCLSPCGDDEMTPNNIAGMAKVANLDIVALTDHNSSRNCPAFFETARSQGLVPVAGMELTTAEDIHVVCLFEKLEDALTFNDYVDKERMLIQNRVDIFGNQIIMDENDEQIGTEENLLPPATYISIDDILDKVESFSGICYPAHIDREANGVIAVLGTFPGYIPFSCFELHDMDKLEEYRNKYPELKDKEPVVSSDAHYLWDINGRENFIELDCAENEDDIRHALFERLRSK